MTFPEAIFTKGRRVSPLKSAQLDEAFESHSKAKISDCLFKNLPLLRNRLRLFHAMKINSLPLVDAENFKAMSKENVVSVKGHKKILQIVTVGTKIPLTSESINSVKTKILFNDSDKTLKSEISKVMSQNLIEKTIITPSYALFDVAHYPFHNLNLKMASFIADKVLGLINKSPNSDPASNQNICKKEIGYPKEWNMQ